MKLQNGDRCDLGSKLEDYCLNPLHPEGRHKARLFRSVLGITLANSNVLRKAIERAVIDSENAVSRGRNAFGQLFNLSFNLQTESGAAVILTA
jgi:hypothetical protein